MRKGRPRKVASKDALQAVMVAFWQNGYSATSMNDIVDASGMSKPSLYAVFGDKEALFEQALVHYFETYGAPVFARLNKAEKDVFSDFSDFLEAIAGLTLDPETPAGCFLVNAVVDCTYGPERHREIVASLCGSRYTAIRDRLLKAVGAGELPASEDVDAIATFIDGQFSAIALLGRGGISESGLKTFVATGLDALPVRRNPIMVSQSGDKIAILRQ